MKEVTDKNKNAQILLNSIRASNYNLLVELVAPKEPRSVSYGDLISELEKYLCLPKNDLVAQHYFLSTYQNESTVADYVATLRRHVSDCNFSVKCDCGKNVFAADRFLTAQFIRGIKNDTINKKLLESELNDFNEIASKAISLEASKLATHLLSNIPST